MPDYSQKHSLYGAARQKRDLALSLYEGGELVEKQHQLLIRHPFETDAQYAIRKERATYRNFAAPIVDVFGSFVCEGREARTLPKALEPMLTDVDRLHSNASTFFDEVVRTTAAGGVRFVLVEMEGSKGGTVSEDKKAGRRLVPYFVDIDANAVWDWGMDKDGLAWVVIHSTEAVANQPFESPKVVDVLTVWTRKDWQKFRGTERTLTATGTELTTVFSTGMKAEGEPVAHPCEAVPLVPFQFEPTSPMTGNPATDDVLSLVLGVYRRYSELDKMLFDCAVPLMVVNGLAEKAGEEFVRASSNMLVSEEKDGISATYVEPTGTSFAAQTTFLISDIQQIREIALRMVRPDSAVGESAEAKKLDNRQLDTQLAKFARRCAAAEKRCWQLAARWLELKVGDDEIITPYNEDYDDNAINKLDKTFVLELARLNMISKATALVQLKKLGTLPEDFEPDEEQAKIAQELMTNAGPNVGSGLLQNLGFGAGGI